MPRKKTSVYNYRPGMWKNPNVIKNKNLNDIIDLLRAHSGLTEKQVLLEFERDRLVDILRLSSFMIPQHAEHLAQRDFNADQLKRVHCEKDTISKKIDQISRDIYNFLFISKVVEETKRDNYLTISGIDDSFVYVFLDDPNYYGYNKG